MKRLGIIALLCVAWKLWGQEVRVVPTFKTGEHQGFAAYWTPPSPGVWVPEWSTNLTHWDRCYNHTLLSNGLHYTEMSVEPPNRVYVRLRRIL